MVGLAGGFEIEARRLAQGMVLMKFATVFSRHVSRTLVGDLSCTKLIEETTAPLLSHFSAG